MFSPTPIALMATAITLTGCAGLHFNAAPQADAFIYYEPSPFAVIKTGADCVMSVDIVTLPGKPRSVSLKSGLGSSKLSLKTTNGMLTDIGQETDTKIPETLTALAGVAKILGAGTAPFVGGVATCKPEVQMRAIEIRNGQVKVGESVLKMEAVQK